MNFFYTLGRVFGAVRRQFTAGYTDGCSHGLRGSMMALSREVSDTIPTHMDSHAADVLDQQLLAYFQGSNPNKVAAIRYHRSITKSSLRYAMDYVERLMERNGIVYTPILLRRKQT